VEGALPSSSSVRGPHNLWCHLERNRSHRRCRLKGRFHGLALRKRACRLPVGAPVPFELGQCNIEGHHYRLVWLPSLEYNRKSKVRAGGSVCGHLHRGKRMESNRSASFRLRSLRSGEGASPTGSAITHLTICCTGPIKALSVLCPFRFAPFLHKTAPAFTVR